MKKNYILDTNVLINDPESIFQFDDNNLFIPIYVIEELDKLKSEQSSRGRNSREACRILDNLRCQGNLSEGVKLENRGVLTIYVPSERKNIGVSLDINSMDNAILQSAIELKDRYQCQDMRSILVTMDVNLRIRAESIGLQTASYENQKVDLNFLNNKVITLDIDYKDINEFYKTGLYKLPEPMEINASVILKSGTSIALGRVKKELNNFVVRKLNIPDSILGLKPRNVEQKFALDLLLDNSVKFVTLMGSAGSGKTIISLSAALYTIFDRNEYDKLLVSRPVIPMGNDIGFLPGTLTEKIRPYMTPIYDNIDYLLMTGGARRKYGIPSSDQLFEDKTIEIEPLMYIRGRSIINQIMLIDESQSLTIHEFKTIVSRCGENTKIIFTGDIEQIDNPYVTKESNGLSASITKIRNNPLVGHIMLEKGERSELANLAVKHL